ncbi:MAG: hypothetical protein EOP19_00080 [Hyphomicrobiales bacterium]|nr:MAG: hypothetical protein EOP19_00080 [Hyphomicrobiales bacterium]
MTTVTSRHRELLRDAFPILKELGYRTTISVMPNPACYVGEGLSDAAITLLERLDCKSYTVVDPESRSLETRAAATELFEAGLLDLTFGRGQPLAHPDDARSPRGAPRPRRATCLRSPRLRGAPADDRGAPGPLRGGPAGSEAGRRQVDVQGHRDGDAAVARLV